MAITFSILALLATFYQAYLQRKHNQRSVMPLGQIDLRDKGSEVFIAIANNGIGPLIVNKVVYSKDGTDHERLSDLLTLNLSSYNFLYIGEGVTKVISPNGQLLLFEVHFEGSGHDSALSELRKELSMLTVNASCKDIYGNKVIVQRNLMWFSRHS